MSKSSTPPLPGALKTPAQIAKAAAAAGLGELTAKGKDIPLTVKYSPRKSKLKPYLDPDKMQAALLADQNKAYDLADADWRQRFPGLFDARQIGMDQVEQSLQGRGDSFLQGALGQAGFGDVNLGQTNEEISHSLGQPIAAKGERDRGYFSSLIDANRPQPLGLNANNVADIALGNSGNKNRTAISAAQAASAAGAANVAAKGEQNAALGSALGSGIGSIVNRFTQPSGPSYLSSSSYGGSALGDYNSAASQFGAGNVGYNSAGAAGTYNSAGQFTEAGKSTTW